MYALFDMKRKRLIFCLPNYGTAPSDCNNTTLLSVLRRKLKVRLQKTVNLEYAKLTFKPFFLIKSQISSEAFISLTSVYLISV